MTTPGKGRADYLELGDWNAACSMCGRKRKASTMVKNWQGMWRCPEHNEPRQPQDFVRGIPDKQTAPWVQTQTDAFISMPYPSTVVVSDAAPSVGDTITITLTLASAVTQDTELVITATTPGVVDAPLTVTVLAGGTTATGVLSVVGYGGTVLRIFFDGQTVTASVSVEEPSVGPADLMMYIDTDGTSSAIYKSITWAGLEVATFEAWGQPWINYTPCDVANDALLIGPAMQGQAGFTVNSVTMQTLATGEPPGDSNAMCRCKSGSEMVVWGGTYNSIGAALDAAGECCIYSTAFISLDTPSALSPTDPGYTWGDVCSQPWTAVGGYAYADVSADNSEGVPGYFVANQASRVTSFIAYASGIATYQQGQSTISAKVGSATYLFRAIQVAGDAKVEVVNAADGSVVTTLTAYSPSVADAYTWQNMASDGTYLLTLLRGTPNTAYQARLWTIADWSYTDVSANYNSLGSTINGNIMLLPLNLTF